MIFDMSIKAALICLAIFIGSTEYKKTEPERRQCKVHGGIVFVGLKNNGVCLYAMRK